MAVLLKSLVNGRWSCAPHIHPKDGACQVCERYEKLWASGELKYDGTFKFDVVLNNGGGDYRPCEPHIHSNEGACKVCERDLKMYESGIYKLYTDEGWPCVAHIHPQAGPCDECDRALQFAEMWYKNGRLDRDGGAPNQHEATK